MEKTIDTEMQHHHFMYIKNEISFSCYTRNRRERERENTTTTKKLKVLFIISICERRVWVPEIHYGKGGTHGTSYTKKIT
mmetsp:Transcript_21544/g.31660  ORF Transcript_21544/g.31660 Transcript_21544/m.31660 type:complete len:80 (-) Transcript_21544:10-249(-)